jgi:uncharacterized membrane protein HdeD (DUF308 family)
MWVVRELVRLVVRVVLGFVVALVLAALWAIVSEHSFTHDLYVTTLFVGCALILMGAVGRGSNFERSMDPSAMNWGRIAGFSTFERRAEDPTINLGVVFVLAGLALLAFAFFVVH